MSTQHTPEPWEVANGTDIYIKSAEENGEGECSPQDDGWRIADCDVAFPFDSCLSSDEMRANAARIVACVNACAGTTTDDLIAITKSTNRTWSGVCKEWSDELHELKQQRDELLADMHRINLACYNIMTSK